MNFETGDNTADPVLPNLPLSEQQEYKQELHKKGTCASTCEKIAGRQKKSWSFDRKPSLFK